MNIKIRRAWTLAGLALVLLPCMGALAAPGAGGQAPLSNAHLGPRHPSTLLGRGLHKQTGYVDLHAPLTKSEAEKVAGYRGVNGQRLLAPTLEQ